MRIGANRARIPYGGFFQIRSQMRKEIEEQAVIYHKTANRPLNDFEIRVNDAAIELAVGDPSLLRKGNHGVTE